MSNPNDKRNTMGSRAGPPLVPASRKGTAGLQNNLQGIASNVHINTQNRPLTNTQSGLIGQNFSSGTGRKIYDKGYYITKLKEQYHVQLYLSGTSYLN